MCLAYDDEISRDHHWGPRANVMYLREDRERIEQPLQTVLNERLPDSFQGFEVHANIGNMTGRVSHGGRRFFSTLFWETDQVPQQDVDWLSLCEVDLFHVTAGDVVYDGTWRTDSSPSRPGLLSRQRMEEATRRLVYVRHGP